MQVTHRCLQASDKHGMGSGTDLSLNLSNDTLLQCISANGQLRLDISQSAYLHMAGT